LGSEIWVGGDIILNIEHTACDTPHNFDHIKEHLEAMPDGETMHMTVLRAGKEVKLTMTYQ